MNIPKETVDRLLRMGGLHSLFEACGWEGQDELLEQYRELLKTTVEEFLPLVQLLVAAGAVTIHVRKQALSEAKRYEDAQFEAQEVFDNGNIWIATDESAGGTPIGKAEPEQQPNGLN